MAKATRATYGIIGYPVHHSLSPVIHNTAFHLLGVEAVYKILPVAPEELAVFFRALKEKDNPVFGLNVTVPYKEKVIPYLDSLAPLAQRVGAVNTVVVTKDRRLIGYNTDAPGFLAHLAELKVDVCDKRVAILGAGGSARALLTALCLIPERPEVIRVFNRTPDRLRQLLADIGDRVDTSIVHPAETIDDLNVELADILINTTSIGLKRRDPCLVPQEVLHAHLFVYDLIYNPSETSLLKAARSKGAKTANGLGMLFFQGVLAFQHWAGMPLPEDVKQRVRQRLEHEAKKG